jgi:hypothetical protein
MTKLLTTTRTELAHRCGAGIEVTLLWSRAEGADETVICVCDRQTGAYFEIPAAPRVALEVYYHPFFYRDFSTLDYEDARLAADFELTGGR